MCTKLATIVHCNINKSVSRWLSSSRADSTDFLDSLSLSVRPYNPSGPADPRNNILCSHRDDVNKFLLVGQHWRVQKLGSTEERHWCARPWSVLHILFILLWRFWRRFFWEVNHRSTTVWWAVASRICSKQHVTVLWNSYLDFSLCILSTSI